MVTDYPDLTRRRLVGAARRLIEPHLYDEIAPLDLAAFVVPGEPCSFDEAAAAHYAPFAVGEPWGRAWGTTWFRVRVPAASGSADERVALFDLGFDALTGFTIEALAWREARPWRALTPNHRWLPLRRSDEEFLVEAASNPVAELVGQMIEDIASSGSLPLDPVSRLVRHLKPGYAGGRAPSMLAMREVSKPLFTMRRASLAIRRHDVYELAVDYNMLLDLALAQRDAAAAADAMAALNRCLNRLDPDDVPGTAAAAREELRMALEPRTGSAAHTVTAVGHAHIDTAWLWPLRETKRKCARTFATALALMEEYPEYRFVASQPAQYAWMKQHYPSVFEGIVRAVKTAQWEPVGSMWVEPDCNLPSGESLVRQIVHGKRFFIEELGVDPCELWLPDTFGYPAVLPQLIVESGSKYFLTQKLAGNQLNKPPHSTFWWEGMDGSRVVAHLPPSDTYNGDFTPSQLIESVQGFKDGGRTQRSLYIYGYGDGGGGPTPEMLDSARRVCRANGVPNVELGSARDFFDRVAAESKDLAVWSGEMYLEFHRGTYTTQAKTKMLNRRAEEALAAAELWSVASRAAYPADELDQLWKTVLTHQFHDILPGSSIDWVHREGEATLTDVIASANSIAERARRSIGGDGDAMVAFNATGHTRREVVDLNGELRVVNAPAFGWSAQTDGHDAGDTVRVDEHSLENGLLRVEWDGDGLITSILDKEAGREVLAAGGRANLLQLHQDLPLAFEAWDVDPYYQETSTDLVKLDLARIEVSHPLRGSVRFRRSFGNSVIDQVMTLDASSRVLRFETEVDWHEDRKFLRVAFPVAVRSPRATYEIQFGHVDRPTHRNTSWDVAQFEVCGHRWADLSEAGFGVALLNDCKYGYDVHGQVMRLSLLRAPAFPDPTADRGHHRFTYALMPHIGDFRTAGVIEAAEALNVPLRMLDAAGSTDGDGFVVSVDTQQVGVSAVKRAETCDDVVVRLHERWGGTCRATVHLGFNATQAWACDLLERERHEIELAGNSLHIELGPFKVATIRIRRA